MLLISITAVADASLVGWWKFDESSGTIAHDSSAYANHGVLHGGLKLVGEGLEFDGLDDYIDCGEGPTLNITGELTVSAWIRLYEPVADRKVVGNQDGVTGGYKFGVYSDRLEFEIRTVDNVAFLNRNTSGGMILQPDVYYHVAGVYSQGNYIRTYVNGILDRELLTTAALGTSTGTFKIGREPFSYLHFWFGFMDDVRVYNRALTQEEILAIMEVESGLVASNPIPADGALVSPIVSPAEVEVDFSTRLSWTPAINAVSYDVFVSDNRDDVAAGDATAFVGNQTETSVLVGVPGSSVPDGLVSGTMYHWRVDSVTASGMKHKGDVWFFFVPPPEKWIPFIPGAKHGSIHEVNLKSSDDTGIIVDSNIPGMYFLDVTAKSEVYKRLSIPYAGKLMAVGKPQVPVIRKYFEVPHDVNFTVEVIHSDPEILEGYHVYPAQEPLPDVDLGYTPEFVIDANVYSSDAFYPAEIAYVDEPIIMRDHRLVILTLCPVQCSPEPRLLKVYSKIEAKIVYDKPARIEGIEERLEAESFESLLRSFVLNYKAPSEYPTRRYNDIGSPSADYLIITHDDFKIEADSLAAWKEKKGLKTMVVKTSDISSPTPPTAADIANYIQTAYENWNPPPTYVLLLGDSEFIPTHYKTPHPCDLHNYFETPTDLYYSPMDGIDDYTPDIHIGRISVDKAAQAETIVNKILKYEKEPTTTKSFYTDVCLAAYFQDKYLKDGYEDRRFVLTSEEIRTYLQTGGYTVNQIYYTHPLVTPTHYNIYTYDSGLPLPWDLLKPGFFWNGNRDDITDKINEGILILNHRGHGLSSNWWNYSINFWGSDYNGWVDPQYTTVDIYTLTNGDMLPVVFSMNCMTGWFDNEIDQLNDPKLIRNDESFCEELLRKQNGGAVAAIGATRVSYSGHNDDLCKGFYDAIWTDFDPLVITEPMFELGQIHTYGKRYMNLQKWWGHEVTEFELFHLFGDPEMRIWTEQPKDLAVAHPMSIVSGEDQKIDVVVKDAISDNPVDHALVCLLKKDDNLQEVGYTDMSGNATFSVTPATAGTMAVTVTKPNCRPCESEIEVN